MSDAQIIESYMVRVRELRKALSKIKDNLSSITTSRLFAQSALDADDEAQNKLAETVRKEPV